MSNPVFHIVVHFGPRENRSEDAIMMNTPVVKAALEMGFSRHLVKQTVQSKILTTGDNYKTISDLVVDLLNAEDEIREEAKERANEEKESGACVCEYSSSFHRDVPSSLCVSC